MMKTSLLALFLACSRSADLDKPVVIDTIISEALDFVAVEKPNADPLIDPSLDPYQEIIELEKEKAPVPTLPVAENKK
jgi:hypothetical protein